MKTKSNNLKDEMLKIYDEFGIDIHQVPTNIQSQLNSLVKEVVKLRKKVKSR